MKKCRGGYNRKIAINNYFLPYHFSLTLLQNQQTMKEIIELAAKNQQKAWEVVRKTDIIDIWKSIGAEINLVGSLKIGLLVKYRDIDFHIYFG